MRNKKICDKCGREVSLSNFNKHYETCKGVKKDVLKIEEEWLEENGLYKCPICGILKTKKGIASHILIVHTEEGKRKNKEIREKYNPFKPGHDTWNKGLTKDTNNVLKERGERLSKRYREGELVGSFKGKTHSKESLNKLSQTIRDKVKEGTWHYSFSKTRIFEYKGEKLHGSWELQYAKWLDENNISWRRPKEKFLYIFKDKERYYTPDFYLIDTKEYIEIKGYETEKDRSKWSQFPLTLKIIKGSELYKLGVINKRQFEGLE